MSTVRKDMRVSVIVPVYNEERLIGGALDALFQQTVAPFEVIVIDNNSTDNTAKIAKAYPGVRVITEEKQGIIYTRYAGFDAVRGDIIASIDADTVVSPGWVGAIAASFQDPELLAVGGQCGLVEFSPSGLYWGKWIYYVTTRLADSRRYGTTGDQILYGHNMALPAALWRKIKPKLYRGPDGVEVIEDLEISALLSTMGKTKVDKRMLAKVHGFRALKLDKIRRYQRLGTNAMKKHRGEAA